MKKGKFPHAVKVAVVGMITGFVNGLFGSGGGAVVVPAMEKFLDVQTHKAHATAIAIILPLSIVSSFVYFNNVEFDFTTLLLISAGGVTGGYVGAKLLNKISSDLLHKIFGAFMIAAGVRMII